MKNVIKKMQKLVVIVLIFVSVGQEINAQTFIVNKIRYKITDRENLTAEVAQHKSLAYRVSRAVIVPTVDYRGKTYTVTRIGEKAFYMVGHELTDVVIPNTVVSIEWDAFYGTTKLETVYIPNSVKYLGHHSFGQNDAIKNVILGDSVRIIDGGVFLNDRNLSTINIPASIDSIGPGAFQLLVKLKKVYCYLENPGDVKYGKNFFKEADVTNSILYVPKGKIPAYKASVWKIFKNIEELISVEGIKVGKTDTTIKVEEKISLTCSVSPATATNKRTFWKSSNPEIAFVNNSGVVTGIKAGKAIITASTNESGYEASCEVTVLQPATGLKLNIQDTTVGIEDELVLVASVLPSDVSDNTVVWSSSAPDIVSVDATTGALTIKKAGDAIIKVVTGDNKFEDFCKVKVVVPVKKVSLNLSDTTIHLNTKFKLSSVIYPLNATNKKITWENSNPYVVTLDIGTGEIVGARVGSSVLRVTAEAGGQTASCKVRVVIPVTKLTSNIKEKTIFVDEEFALSAEIFPVDATDKSIRYVSSNESVATVDDDGKVVGVSSGLARIMLFSTTTGVKDSCDITVKNIDIEQFIVTPEEKKIEVGQEFVLNYKILPINNIHKSVLYASSDESVATVDNFGKVSGLSVGIADITASIQGGSFVSTCKLTVVGLPSDISEGVESGVLIYPNPTSGELFLQVATESNLQIANVVGEVVVSQVLQPGRNVVNIKQSGVYFVKIKGNDFKVEKKIIVR